MIKITKKTQKFDVYDLEVEQNHNFFANGILVKNCEIVHHTKPLTSLQDEEAEIGVCILSSINILEIKNEDELKSTCNIIVRLLEELIDYQQYPVKAAENFCKNRRSLGVGVTNFAAWLAKQKLLYDSEQALPIVDSLFEKIQYYMLKTSNELAKEKGACSKFADTKYARGLLPFDWANKNALGLVCQPLSMDWEQLRADIKTYGLRHSTVSTQMPVESCLKKSTKIRTNYGDLDFHQICEKGSINWQMIENDNAVGWHELVTPIKVDTRDGFKIVEKIYYNGIAQIFQIKLVEKYEKIYCTSQHKFFSLDYDDWISAENLSIGDEIIGGTIEDVSYMRADHTYDLEVADVHEYFSADFVLNHNSSVITSSTNGIEPIRKIITFKKAKNGTLKQLAPMYPRYKNYYTLAFDIQSNDCINKLAAIMQKWIDMSISLNHYYNYAHYPDGQIPRSVIVRDLITAYKYGIKTLYYANSPDGDLDAAGSCASGSCSI